MNKYRGKDSRPAECFICQEKLYYVNHTKHRPEYTIRVEDAASLFTSAPWQETMYAHRDCWINLLFQLEKTHGMGKCN